MTSWERKRNAIKSLELLKLAIEQARTATLDHVSDDFITAASKFEFKLDDFIYEIMSGTEI